MCRHVLLCVASLFDMARTSISLPVDGTKLRTLRELRGNTQNEIETLTKQAGHRVERSRLSLIENGVVKPTAKQLKALVDLYAVPVDEVLVSA